GLSAFLVAGLPGAPPEVSVDAYPPAPLPAVPPKASPQAFEAASRLGSVATVVGDVLPLCPDLGNQALMANFSLGPWLHVGSEVQHLGLVEAGAEVSVRGRVARWWEQKGHRFVELDLVVVGTGERPLALVRHTAIYEPASR
ncbi:MAG TPA: hypothetical protein VK131_10505, partial [Candidatus Acidoferrales bacterium]|nr:hypothetical protein [Candidatus Acidoferrales bacterium]